MTETKQKIQLVEGKFTPSEASDVVTSLIEEKINFHKLQRLSLCEGHQEADTAYPDGRIGELYNEKRIAREYIAEARRLGYRLKIDGILEISFVK
jgi:hypothetical protein